MKRFTILLILSLVASIASVTAKDFVLVIDAGHGGKDAGAVGAYSKEKDINLKVALAFGRYVEKNCPDVKVIYTRKTDVFLELFQRADIANKNHADVFVSIHTNAIANNHSARGVETYSMTLRRSEEKLTAAQLENSVVTYEDNYEEKYSGYDNASEETIIMYEVMHEINMKMSVDLAKAIQGKICSSANRPNKGVKQDNFHVLRRTSMPACLVEVGFISTPDEEAYLNNASNIDKTAYGIYLGFVEYKNHNYAQSQAFTPAAGQKQAAESTTAKTSDRPAAKTVEKVTEKPSERTTAKAEDIAAAEPMASAPAQQDEEPKAARRRRETSEARTLQEPKSNVSVEAPQQQTKKETVQQQPAKTEVAQQQPTKKEVSQQQPTKKETPLSEKKEETKSAAKAPEPAPAEGPVYKVQFLTGIKALKDGAREFKGLTGVSYYKEGNVYKFTVGEAATLNEASNLKKKIADIFPDAFIVAFLDGQRIDLNKARQWKK